MTSETYMRNQHIIGWSICIALWTYPFILAGKTARGIYRRLK